MLLVGATACSFTPGVVSGVDDARPADTGAVDGAIDGPSADAPADAVIELGPWSTPAVMTIATLAGDDDPTLTEDRLEIYFNRANDIYRATRASLSDAWSTPVVDVQLSSAAGEGTPEITSDGLTIFFMSDRASGVGGQDIWMATRASRSDPWGAPTLVPGVNSTGADRDGAVTNDLLTIVLTRTVNNVSVLFTSTRASSTTDWPPATALTELNMPDANGGIYAQDRLTVYFTSVRGGTSDLYVATRDSTSAAFAAPVAISELNTSNAEEVDIWVSADQRHAVFVSNRGGMTRLYETSR
jgi:hypothetical protein